VFGYSFDALDSGGVWVRTDNKQEHRILRGLIGVEIATGSRSEPGKDANCAESMNRIGRTRNEKTILGYASDGVLCSSSYYIYINNYIRGQL